MSSLFRTNDWDKTILVQMKPISWLAKILEMIVSIVVLRIVILTRSWHDLELQFESLLWLALIRIMSPPNWNLRVFFFSNFFRKFEKILCGKSADQWLSWVANHKWKLHSCHPRGFPRVLESTNSAGNIFQIFLFSLVKIMSSLLLA